jgi:sugar fermentation stimulation protein A
VKRPGIQWPPLVSGTLLRRYQRFLADVRLDSGETVTAHCPNTGSMTGCSEPGRRVFLSRSENPKRKYPFTWELILMPDGLVGVNTQMPNRLVEHAVRKGQIRELAGYEHVRREVRLNSRSRVDLMLEDGNDARCYVEVKNCTLVQDGVAMFPDAVTARGLKHLLELQQLLAEGHRSLMFYFIQRMDARQFRPADEIDPQYGKVLREVWRAGVEVLAYDVGIDLGGIWMNRKVPSNLG